jgi:PAS domain S-box-containing protein
MATKNAAPVILHVDDYAPGRYARTRALQEAGYVVVEATSGEAAIRAARDHHPALAILDVNLPDMSGLEVCRVLKQDPLTSQVLVLHVSATAIGLKSRLEGLENGADSYLTEPVDTDELLAQVAALLRLRSAEQRVEQAHATLAAVLDAAPLPMIAIGRDGVVVMWNRAAERVFGPTSASARGRTWPPPGDAHDELRLRISRVHETAGFTGVETTVTRDDRSVLRVSVSAAPLQGNGFDDGVLLIYEDITSRKLAEEQVARALVASEITNRAKDEFLAVLSHELRTPLNAVLGWIRMLRRGELAPGRAAHALAVIERNAIAQVRLVEDILDVSRIVSGKLHLTPMDVDLAHVVRTAVDAAQPLADAKQLTVALDVPQTVVPVRGDPSRLEQIVANLLGNAIKFSSLDGAIRVTLQEQHGCAVLAVADQGAGIEPEFLPFVFDRFSQGNSTTTRSHGGLGLGLAIVRHLVEAHGGTATVQSEGSGRGSTFTVTLPLVDATELGCDVLPGPAAALQDVRALVVDGRDGLRDMLHTHGAEVTAVTRVADALQGIDMVRPDVIVVDLETASDDGYALVQRVRNWFDPGIAATPVIAINGETSVEGRARAAGAGFASHLTAPVDGEQLVDAIRSVLRS